MNASYLTIAAALLLTAALGCSTVGQSEERAVTESNQVIETIMSRRSVRDYQPRAVARDTMETIVKCGINAPNAMNRQSWEIRVVDNPEFIDGVTQLFAIENQETTQAPGFRNIFRNAPTVVFIASNDTEYSKVDCGLLGENMILAAWSMGIGSCCLGGPVRFLKTEAAAEYLAKLGFSEGYTLLYAIGFGYPAETPDARPRDYEKVVFLD